MKTGKKICLVASLFISFQVTVAQVTVTSSGGNATGTGGSVSYTIGQTDYTASSNTNGSVCRGVQQPFEFFTVSVPEPEAFFSLVVFPNPATDNITIMNELQSVEILTCELYDANCKLIEKTEMADKSITISMLDAASGTYYLIIRNSQSELKTIKIIKN